MDRDEMIERGERNPAVVRAIGQRAPSVRSVVSAVVDAILPPEGEPSIIRRHMEHYRSCGCLDDSDVCCDPKCCPPEGERKPTCPTCGSDDPERREGECRIGGSPDSFHSSPNPEGANDGG
jgi:hypothetical protein